MGIEFGYLLRGRADAGTEIVRSDLSDYTTLVEALRGAEAAYYLVHAMGAPVDFENEDWVHCSSMPYRMQRRPLGPCC